MQGIIPIILQRTKSASDSIISSPVYQGDGALVISARVFHRGEIFVISSRVYQVGDTSHLGTGVSRRKVARSHCQMPAIPLLLFPHHLRYPSHSNITFSRFFPTFEHYFFLLRLIVHDKCQILSTPLIFIQLCSPTQGDLRLKNRMLGGYSAQSSLLSASALEV